MCLQVKEQLTPSCTATKARRTEGQVVMRIAAVAGCLQDAPHLHCSRTSEKGSRRQTSGLNVKPLLCVPDGGVQRPISPWLLPPWHFPEPRDGARQPCAPAWAAQAQFWWTPPGSSLFPACLPGPCSFLWSRTRPEPWVYLLSTVEFNPDAILPICSKKPSQVSKGRESWGGLRY